MESVHSSISVRPTILIFVIRACIKRIVKHASRLKLLETVQEYAVKYSIIALQQPDLFPPLRPVTPTDQILNKLRDGFHDNFLTSMIAELTHNDPGDLQAMFAPVISELRGKLENCGDDIGGAMASLIPLTDMLRHKPLRPVATSLPTWLPANLAIGRQIQTSTFLGGLYSFSLCPTGT